MWQKMNGTKFYNMYVFIQDMSRIIVNYSKYLENNNGFKSIVNGQVISVSLNFIKYSAIHEAQVKILQI